MRLQSQIKAYWLTFKGQLGIKTVIVGDSDKVNAAVLNDMEYPLLWVMYPFEQGKNRNADVPKRRWKFEILVLKHAKPDEEERIAQNFDDTQIIGEAILQKLRDDSKADWGKTFEFDEINDTEMWQPKEQFGGDNCNGWLIPLSFLTA